MCADDEAWVYADGQLIVDTGASGGASVMAVIPNGTSLLAIRAYNIAGSWGGWRFVTQLILRL